MEVVVIQPRNDVARHEPKFSGHEPFLTLDVIRKDGIVEAVQARSREVKAALKERGGVAVFKIQLVTDRKPRTVLVLRLEYNEEKTRITHMTVRELASDDVIRVRIPLNAVGELPVVAANRAELVQETDRLKVRCAVAKLPAGINVPVSSLEVGGAICASDVKLPDGVALVASNDEVLFTLKEIATDSKKRATVKAAKA